MATGGQKKIGRNKKKAARKGSPISMFVRNKISAKQYWEAIGMSLRGTSREDNN